jgi:hypothetical protein
MNHDEIFWITLWKIVAATLCIIVVSLTSCSITRTLTVKELVLNGTDPMKAGCIFDSNSDASRAINCNVAIQK